MSVWKSTIYRDAAFQWAAQRLPADAFFNPPDFLLGLLDFEIEDPGMFSLPEGVVPGNARKQCAEFPWRIARIATRPSRNPSYAFHATIQSLPSPMFGVHGVYNLFSRFYPLLFDQFETDSADYVKNIWNFGLSASAHSRGDIFGRMPIVDKVLKEVENPIRFAIRTLLRLRYSFRKASSQADERLAEARMKPLSLEYVNIAPFLMGWKYLSFRGVLLLVTPFQDKTFVLLPEDFDRLERLMLGFASVRIYSHFYGDYASEGATIYRKAVIEWQDYVASSMGRLTKTQANSFCRAMDVVFFIYLTSLATDINDNAHRHQLAKFRKEGLDEIVESSTVIAMVQRLKPKEALEVLQQYKCLPVADFDYFGMMGRQAKMWQERREVADEFWTKAEFKDLMLYYKHMMIIGFNAKHGRCPGFVKDDVEEKRWHDSYPYVDPLRVPYAEVGDIDLNGEFIYRSRGKDCLDLVKDKAICPDSVKNLQGSNDLFALPVRSKSQLMDVLSRSAMPNTEELWQNFERLNLEVKGDDKPESKKPNGRMFFELASEARLCISEYEDSVSEYAKFIPGVTAGMSTGELVESMNRCTAPLPDEFHDTALIISFDLEKWSPTFQAEAHYAMDELWAEAFGKPELKKASLIFSSGNVHYIKGNIHHTFPKIGNEYEGHFARKGTVYHCAVMGWSVRRLKNAELTKRGANFASLLDDGIVRVITPSNTIKVQAPKIQKSIETSYNHAGYFISWDKTVFSRIFAIFLNEIRMWGHSVTPGTKSVLKIHNRSDQIAPTLVSDVQMANSTTRGALNAGALPTGAYFVYCLSVRDALRRWGHFTDTKNPIFALRSFLPPDMGGMGVSSMMNLAGSLAFDQTVEALGVLRICGIRYQALQGPINELINNPVVPISAEDKMRDPTRIRFAVRRLRIDRGAAAIMRHLSDPSKVPVLRDVMSHLATRDDWTEEYISDVPDRFPVELRERLLASSAVSVLQEVLGKFQKSKSALSFVPHRALFRALTANVTEARKYVALYSFGNVSQGT